MVDGTCVRCGASGDTAATCPGCGAPTVAVRHAAGDDGASLVVVATFPQTYLGALAKSRLEAEGVTAVLSDEHLAGLMALAGGGGVTLRVRRDQAALALEILSVDATATDVDVDAAADPPAADEPGAACPFCRGGEPGAPVFGAGPIERVVRLVRRALGRRARCPACGAPLP